MSAREQFIGFVGNIPSALGNAFSWCIHAIPWVILGLMVYVAIGFLCAVIDNYLEKKSKNGSYLHVSGSSGVYLLFWPILVGLVIICSPAGILNWFLKRKGVPEVAKKKTKKAKSAPPSLYRQDVLNKFVEKKSKI